VLRSGMVSPSRSGTADALAGVNSAMLGVAENVAWRSSGPGVLRQFHVGEMSTWATGSAADEFHAIEDADLHSAGVHLRPAGKFSTLENSMSRVYLLPAT